MGALKSKFKGSKSKSSQKAKTKIHLPESSSAKKTVDPRLPFQTYRQIFSLRNAWKAVTRSMEETAKENLMRFLKKHDQFAEYFPSYDTNKSEEDIKDSFEFENDALEIFGLFDDVVNNLEEVDKALVEINHVFSTNEKTSEILKAMDPTFMGLLSEILGDRYTETTEENFRLLYDFVLSEGAKCIGGKS
ncbi:hemoglobin subunit alpha-D-like [Mytilus trossulus]|uniref:hemoglobin subunit alpha-D-like n=1 Tax=Mytilus trossulus TaxID=6551 RepID=UPI0030068F7D